MTQGNRSTRVWWPLSLEQWLLSGALFYALATIIVQLVGNTPVWQETSPVEISSDLVASLGLAFAGFQAVAGWSYQQLRTRWLLGCLGMLMIWSCETAVDKLGYVDYRLIISIWIAATIPIFVCIRFYSTERTAFGVLWVGVVAQLASHVAWIIQDGFLDGPVDVHPLLEMLIDTGQLLALLGYIVAFVLTRLSRLDVNALHKDRLQRWLSAKGKHNKRRGRLARPRICFPYNAQTHQIFHSLPIAISLAKRYPEMDVHIAGPRRNILFVQNLLRKNRAEPVSVRFDTLYVPWMVRRRNKDGAVGSKRKILRANQLYFSGFDVIVIPERTSIYLRKICPNGLKLIGTEHGAGDRAVGFAAETALYDFLLLPGEKQARRLLELGHIRPGNFISGIYAKFDLAYDAEKVRFFGNDRPTILYNPHFAEDLSSWHLIGRQVLDHFARSTAYNLIFAPHIRLFDAPTSAKYQAFEEYRHYPHLRIDLGSEHCVDMTYTRSADIYLGDVSSQVVEFIVRPRPCVFLDPRNICWQQDPHYRFWHLGPVVSSVNDIDSAIREAIHLQQEFEHRQRTYLFDTLGQVEPGQSGLRGAEAIAGFLRRTAIDSMSRSDSV
ncbi:hypothetical protein [Azomonas macrocytogenes]|uniref:Uncharacterized protein n=1 Tax=Azomonas macrocytogenes TaxID=69962 RepID=A0A839SYC0_AZOMA|nr:hypothetical protein [Azomonas macrocytogenes]MBB3102347.1 hypothetical protein [Azomonas macrocytogenes]